MRECEYLIIGGGIAGASLAYHLTDHSDDVVILEREDQPGYHSTGRSAAIFTENYGPRIMRVMSKISGPFLRRPPSGFSDVPLLHDMGVVFVGREDQKATMAAILKELQELSDTIKEVSVDEATAASPPLKRDYVAVAAHDPATSNMDVNAIHMGYLKKARASGTTLVTEAEVVGMERKGGLWHVRTAKAGAFAAPVVVNAAGAWADPVADLAGARKIGLQPKRRTAIVFDPPAGANISKWAAGADCEEQWYYKPDAGQVLGSPADETPVPPQDIQPDEMDIAIVADRIQTATNLEIKRINRSWAGLRSFVSDKCPVVGFAPDAEGFFWLAGQGGYGIQTSWAIGLTASAMVRGQGVPEKVAGFDLTEKDLGPQRLWD
jgi:D-arginine dehydrogenase